jgi:hypothetical protein
MVGAASNLPPRRGDSVLPGSKNQANAHKGSPGTWETCSSPPRNRPGSAEPETSRPPAGHPGSRGAKRWRQRVVLPDGQGKSGGKDGQESERPHSTVEAGEPISEEPCGGKGASSHRTVGGKHGGGIELRNCVHATTTDSRVGPAIAADGVHIVEPPPRPAVAARSLPTHTQGWGNGRGRTNGLGLREGSGEKSSVASGPSQVRHVPGSTRATCAYSERVGFHRNPSYRNPTFEDKVLQRAVVLILEAIYEQDLRDCSFGFRVGRGFKQGHFRVLR